MGADIGLASGVQSAVSLVGSIPKTLRELEFPSISDFKEAGEIGGALLDRSARPAVAPAPVSTAPELPDPVPAQAEAGERTRRRESRGRASTILTGSRGLLDSSRGGGSVSRRVLLGS